MNPSPLTVSDPPISPSPYEDPPSASETVENRRKEPKVSRACDSCKSKKIRCSGTLPCNICTRRKLSCTYAARYGRGRAPTPLSLTPNPHNAHPGTPASTQTRDGATNRARSNSINHVPPPVEHSVAPVEVTTNAASTPRASSELVIEGQYFDRSSGLTFLHRARRKLSVDVHPVSYGLNDAEKNQLLASAGDRPFHLENAWSEVLPDDETVRGLTAFYFDNCVVTYRMFHRQTVETWLNTIISDRAQGYPVTLSVGISKAAIILTILAIASFRKHKVSCRTANDGESLALRESDPLFCAAMQFTDGEVGFPRLESAQARLIQVLYLLQTVRMNKAWYTFGTACQIISSLGFHRRQSRQPNAPLRDQPDYVSHQCAKRVFWTAYVMDKYLSVVFGRPRLLHDDEIDQEFPDTVNDEDMGPHGPSTTEAGEEPHAISLIFHAKVARLIAQISREVYSVGDARSSNQAAAAHDLVHQLHTWHAGLPPHLGTVKPSTLVPSFRREATALSLAYFHAVIHATRPFLLGDGCHSGNEPEVQDRIRECLSAARKALELVSKMASDTHLFHSFWWTQYVLFCALAVVYVWEIQQNSNNPTRPSEKTDTSLYELAETCRSRFLQGGSGAPPSHRYGIILEELRLEAQQQASRAGHLPSISTQVRETSGPIGDGTSLEAAQGVPAQVADAIDPSTGSFQSLSAMLDNWQNTDWLDLDSSAFYPIFDSFNGLSNHLEDS